MEKFYCLNCKKIFEAKGKKKEWESSVFGRCWKLVAECPDCYSECCEYRAKISGKENSSCSGTCNYCPGCS